MMTPSPHFRLALLAGTALLWPGLALAQPAPDARPQGGQVVAGSAIIGGDAGRTVIQQSTDRAAINWQSFDVGRNQAVQFQQPSTSSVTLNRVITPNPSQIAGRITANGQVAIVNQSGVVFHQGAQVDAAGFVASTANISNEAFMRGGRMTFDQPGRPDARIENNGTITVREAGLAALVAPQVANRGVIRARMGRVVLAGAETSVVDLHGDGLLSLEITSPVTQAPTNGEALVTNTGRISATGGTVVLTAQAVDGLVQDLVRAGGRVAANTDAATGRTGRVVVTGNGGHVRIEGRVSAQGRAAGTTGGDIQILGDRTLVDSTARVNASGRAGGGTVAIGVTPNGAANRRLSQRAGIAPGAVVRADATEHGHGGTVLLNSSDYTVHAGLISVRGGPQGGDGGFAEVSSGRTFHLPGEVRVGAGPGGRAGTLLIDPDNLTIVAGASGTGSDDGNVVGGVLNSSDSSGDQTISNGFINAFSGNLVLQANSAILVSAAIDKPVGNLGLEAGTTLTVGAGGSILIRNGDLALTGQSFVFEGPTTANNITFTASAGAVSLGATISQTTAGVITAGSITQTNPTSFTDVGLGTADNLISAIGTLNAGGGSVGLRTMRSLTVTTAITAGVNARIDVFGGDLTMNGNVSAETGQAIFRATGSISQGAGSLIIAPTLLLSGGLNAELTAVDPASGAETRLAGNLRAGSPGNYTGPTGTIILNAGQGGIVQTGGTLEAFTLSANTTGSISLPGSANPNYIERISNLTAAGDALVHTRGGGEGDLTLTGAIQVGGAFTLTRQGTSGIWQDSGATLSAGTLNVTTEFGGADFLGDNQVTKLGTISTEGEFGLRTLGHLAIIGPITGSGTYLDVGGDVTMSGSIASSGNVRIHAGGHVDLAAGSSIVTTDPSGGSRIAIYAGYDPDAETTNTNGPSRLTLGGIIGEANGTAPLILGAGTGGITQSGGRIITPDLTVLSGGDALLDAPTGGANSVGTIGLLQVQRDFALDNGVTDLQVTHFGQTISLNSFAVRTAGTVTLNAPIEATERASFRVGALQFQDPVSVGLPVTVTAPLVEIAPDAAQAMAILPSANSPEPFQLTQDFLGRLETGALRFGATTFRGVTTTSASAVVFANNFEFAGTIDARAAGDVTQASGTSLAFGTLAGAAGGDFRLDEAGNTLATLGDVSAGAALTLRTTGSQLLTGQVSGAQISLTTGGDLTQGPNGRLAGGTLRLMTGGDALLGGANALSGLGTSQVGGRLELANASTQFALPVGETVLALGGYEIRQSGDLLVDGTITGATGALSASGRLQINNRSAIAQGGDLTLRGFDVGLNGLLQASGTIDIEASQSATLAGTASAALLRVTAPQITFGALDATGTPVALYLGATGRASGGALQAAALSVFGGAGVSLTGAIAGITGGPAAAAGKRGQAGGTLLTEPLPRQNLFLFNGCPLGAASCAPPVTPTGFLATNANMAAQAASLLAGATAAQQLRPPVPAVSFSLFRDRSEEGELAPPNIRGEDF